MEPTADDFGHVIALDSKEQDRFGLTTNESSRMGCDRVTRRGNTQGGMRLRHLTMKTSCHAMGTSHLLIVAGVRFVFNFIVVTANLAFCYPEQE
jgi:hypothetical protein